MARQADKRTSTQGASARVDGRFGGRGASEGRPRRDKGATQSRLAALEVVRALRERGAFAQEVIGAVIDDSSLSREDRAFATRLALGVASMRGVLDEVLDRCMRSPDDVEPDVRDALQISTYEIIYLDKSPHAAVDQGVELVRSVAPRAGGVANAVLRKVVAAKESFPFGDPMRSLPAFARLHGFPCWLAERLVRDLGTEGAHDFMRASNEPAPLFVAVNAVRAADAEVFATLADAHGEPRAVRVEGEPVAGCCRVSDGRVLLDGRVKRLLNNGALLVSDATSQAVAQRVLPAERPASFLEIGAGRATKTILMQSNAQRRWGAQIAEYVTVDNHAFKTRLLEERAQRYGVHVSEALTADATDLASVLGSRTFDVVFLDAPCTGLGTLRRHPEIRWRIDPAAIEEHAELAARLLASAAAQVAPGGVLAYATCTVTPEENARVVAGFLKSAEGAAFQLAPLDGKSAFSTRLVPGGPDAHFLACLRREK